MAKLVLEENRKRVAASHDAVKTKGEHSTTVVPHGTKVGGRARKISALLTRASDCTVKLLIKEKFHERFANEQT